MNNVMMDADGRALFVISPKLFVCSDEDGCIFLYSIKTQSRRVWVNKESNVISISSFNVSPNNEIVAGQVGKHCLMMINAANGNSICSVDVGDWIWRVLFLSQYKIACGLQNGTVAIVCWKTQKIVKILRIDCRWSVYALAISPVNNDILLTGDYDGVIRRTIISSEKTLMVYEGHTNAVFDLKFLSCGNMFVSGSDDRTARLFSVDQKQAIRVFKGHTHWIRSVSLIHDDELLMTGSWDGIVKVWNVNDGKLQYSVKIGQRVYNGCISKDEKYVAIVDGKIIFLSCPPRFAVSLDRTLKLGK